MRPSLSAHGEYVISTDKFRLDVPAIHRYLSESSYWARGRSLQAVATSIDRSLCFGVYAADGSQVGFARVITDLATFAWICDVFILEAHRGLGLGKRLIEAVVEDPDLKHLRRILLATRDAHGLYSTYGGFRPLQNPERWMERFGSASDPVSREESG